MRRILTLLSLLWALASAGWAQSEAPTVLYIPLQVAGNVRCSAKEFNDGILQAINAAAPQLKVTVATAAADDDRSALALARQARCKYVIYGDAEMKKGSMLISMGGGSTDPNAPVRTGSPVRYMVSLRGRATLHALEVASGQVLATQPELFYRSRTSMVDDDKIEQELSKDFVEQLSHRLIEHLEMRIQKNRAASPSTNP